MRRPLSKIAACLAGILKIVGAVAALIAVSATAVILNSGDENFQFSAPDTLVNDITQLNPIRVGRVVRPATIADISRNIVETGGPISIGGGRYSQGGQTAYPDSLHFDMRSFNRILSVDVAAREVTVQAGVTWRQLQETLDPRDLSVRIMQTYANFTVGGSLSVNVHGRYVGEGPLVHSVRAIKMVLADGSVVSASPTENKELFYGAIGGYGGLGVIVEATLAVTDNRKIERRVSKMAVEDYHDFFFEKIRGNPAVVFHNADIYPPEYTQVRQVSWYVTDRPVTVDERLIPTDRSYFWGPRLAEFVADYAVGKWLRENVMEPIYYLQDRVVWRNWEASYDVRELEPADRGEYTYGLREYFVPVARLEEFVPRMREIFARHQANILNVSIRHAKADPGTLLAWAREEVFAFVVYYRQGTDRLGRDAVRDWSIEMIDAVTAAGGSYYLPYQNAATPAQFRQAYPRVDEFFALKRKLDPQNRFRSEFWASYFADAVAPPADALATAKSQIADYFRSEEQTVLTIPEWYLVFSPEEYADFLDRGGDPGTFPFFASIDEYWTLYDRTRAVAAAYDYPPNARYLTMLRIIGISTTVEYMLKGAYEQTIGRFTRWTAGGDDTSEEAIIRRAHRAYSNLIHDEPWYRFPFWSWVETLWRESDLLGADIIRKTERRLFFTVEFGIKAIYAAVLGHAAESTYGISEDTIFLVAHTAAGATSELPAGVHTVERSGHRQLLAVPRWGGFTRTIPRLVAAGFEFDDISGNHWIAASVIVDRVADVAIGHSSVLFTSRKVSSEGRQRLVVLVPVAQLHDFIRSVNASGAQLEHLYDF